jgi:C-terminal peptidase prc
MPAPQRADLTRAAVLALAKEHERQSGEPVSAAQRDAWVSGLTRTGSFEDVLKALARPGVNAAQLVGAGLAGMLGATGWGSAGVLPPAEAEALKQAVRARGERPTEERGLLGMKLDHWPTVEVIPGGPAADAGLRDGDRLTTVGGEAVGTAKTATQALKLLQGPAGTLVKVTAERDGKQLTFEVKRASAAVAQVSCERIRPDVLLMRIATFEGAGIAEKVRRLLDQAGVRKGQSVILDLRDNPGGRPEEANGVADIFLDSQPLLVCEFRSGKRIAFKSHPGALEMRVIVLTNKGTGSGAEILALALRENAGAPLVGEPTAGALFGKELAELVGGQTIVFRTEPTVLSPTGRDYSRTGVPPDVEVPDDRGKNGDTVLSRALELYRPQDH